MSKRLLLMISLMISVNAYADVQLEIKDGHSGVNTISSDGKRARIENAGMPGFTIFDFASGDMFMVNSERAEIVKVNINTAATGDSSGGSVTINLKKKGGGPVIAGYATQRFDYLANGIHCGTVYTSSKLLKNNSVRAMFESMRALQQQSRNIMGAMSGFLDPCQQAGFELADSLGSSGAPMRMLDQKGQLVSEVVSVNTDASQPAAYYQLPDGMKLVSMEEMMGQAAEQTQQMMQNMPNMDELMQQLQQGGGEMSEEMQQQMQKMQDMLKQMQQQQAQ